MESLSQAPKREIPSADEVPGQGNTCEEPLFLPGDYEVFGFRHPVWSQSFLMVNSRFHRRSTLLGKVAKEAVCDRIAKRRFASAALGGLAFQLKRLGPPFWPLGSAETSQLESNNNGTALSPRGQSL